MVTLSYSEHRINAFLVKTKKKAKSKKVVTREKVYLELLHHGLVHRSTRLLMYGYTVNVWHDIYLRIYPGPFHTSFEISPKNKKAWSKTPLKPKSSFKWVFMEIISSTSSKSLIGETTFSDYILIVGAYSTIPKLYGMEIITDD